MAHKQPGAWWGAPRNFLDRKYERKVGWLELFYDLVYVAAVGQLTDRLAADFSLAHVVLALLLFALIFWSWVNGSQYYDLHGNDGIRTRLFTLLEMLAIAAVAITLPDALTGHLRAFGICFGLLELLITYLWWSVGFYDPYHRVFSRYYTTQYLLAFGLIVLSLFSPGGWQVPLWVAVLILDLTPGLTGARTIVRGFRARGQVFTASATLVERFGLFAIIVLAESILGTVTGVAEIAPKTVLVWMAFSLGILVAWLLWSLYFDMTGGGEAKEGYGYMQLFIFLHFPLLAAFCITGACLRIVLGDATASVPPAVKWVLCISLSIVLACILGVSTLMRSDKEDLAFIRPASVVIIAAAVLVALLPAWASFLPPVAFLGLIAVLLFLPVAAGIGGWIRYMDSRSRQHE